MQYMRLYSADVRIHAMHPLDCNTCTQTCCRARSAPDVTPVAAELEVAIDVEARRHARVDWERQEAERPAGRGHGGSRSACSRIAAAVVDAQRVCLAI